MFYLQKIMYNKDIFIILHITGETHRNLHLLTKNHYLLFLNGRYGIIPLQSGLLCNAVRALSFSQKDNITIPDIESGVKLVKQSNGDLALYSDSTTISFYNVQKKPCDLVEIGTFNVIYLGWALKKKADFKNSLNLAISHLKLSGEYQQLKDRWWKGECANVQPVAGSADHAAAAMLKAVIVGLLLAVAMLYQTVI